MKKLRMIGIVVAIAGLLVAAHLGISWGIGRYVENATQAQLEKLQAEAPYLKVISQSHQTGLFNSTQEIVLGINSACFENAPVVSDNTNAAPLTFTVHNRIQHGPIIFHGGLHFALVHEEGELILPPEIQSAVQDAFGKQPLLTWNGFLTYTGEHDLTLSSPSAKMFKPTGSLNWSGVQGKITYSASSGAYSFKLQAPLLQANGNGPQGGQVNVEKIIFSGQGERGIADLNLGSVAFTIDNVQVTSPMSGAGQLRNFKIQATSLANGEYVDLDEEIQVDQLAALGKQYGPLTYHFALNHLHAETLAQLGKAFQQVMCVKPSERDARLSEAMQTIKAQGIALLNHKPELLLKQIHVALPEGEFHAQGHVNLPNFSAQANDGNDVLMAALVRGLDAEFEASVAQSLVRQLTKQQMFGSVMQRWMLEKKAAPSEQEMVELNAEVDHDLDQQMLAMRERKLVVADGNNFKLQFKFVKGEATLNGAPFQSPIPLLTPPAAATQ